MAKKQYRLVGGLKASLGFAALMFAVLVLGPHAIGTTETRAEAQSLPFTQTEYFPDGYVNQATTLETPAPTF